MGDRIKTLTATITAVRPPPPPPAVADTSTLSKIPFRPRKIRKLSNPNSNPKDDIITPPPPRPLTSPAELSSAMTHLRSADPRLSRIIDSHQPPSFQSQQPQASPFLSLARSILYQQLATKAAASIYSRFLSLCCDGDGEGGVPTPASVLALSPLQLRGAGVSARKASYLHDLAGKFNSGELADSEILSADDDALSSRLTAVKGIGPWSVHMFLIFSLHRPDVLPVGDLGVRKGVQMLYGMKETPKPVQVEQLCEKWRPYRSVGAWYMWRLVESKGSPAMASASSVNGNGWLGTEKGGDEAMQRIDPSDSQEAP